MTATSRACSTRRRPSPDVVTGLFGTTIITGIVNTNGNTDDRLAEAQFAGQLQQPVRHARRHQAIAERLRRADEAEHLIAVEVFTAASPWVLSASLMGGAGSTSLRSYALYQPRLGSLSTVTAGNRP